MPRFAFSLQMCISLAFLGGCSNPPHSPPPHLTRAQHLHAVDICTPVLTDPAIQKQLPLYQSISLSSGYCYGTCSPQSVVFYANGTARFERTDFETRKTTQQSVKFSKAQFNRLAALAIHARAARVPKPPIYITDVPSVSLQASGVGAGKWAYIFPGEESDAIKALANCVGKERNRLFPESEH